MTDKQSRAENCCTLASLHHFRNKLYRAGRCHLMAAAQCAGCQRRISQSVAGSKGGTNIWEGLDWSHTKN